MRSASQVRSGSRPAARRIAAPPRAPFVMLIIALLGGALVSLLLLNTVLAKDAFTLSKLEQQNKELQQTAQEEQRKIDEESSPENLAEKAKALGMKENPYPRFYYPGTGRTSGGKLRPVPEAAAASAGAGAVVGVPGTVVPGDGVPQPTANGSAHANGAGGGTGGGSAHGGARNGGGRP